MSILQTPDLQIGADQSLVDEGDVFRDHRVQLQLNFSASSSRPTKCVFAENVFWLRCGTNSTYSNIIFFQKVQMSVFRRNGTMSDFVKQS